MTVVDCDDSLAENLRHRGYVVEQDYTGFFHEHPDIEVSQSLHEVDFLVVDLDPGWSPREATEMFTSGQLGLVTDLHTARDGRRGVPTRHEPPIRDFEAAINRGAWLVCLVEKELALVDPAVDFGFAWLPPSSHTVTIERTVDKAVKVSPHCDQHWPPLAQIFRRYADSLVSRRALQGGECLLLNDKGQSVAVIIPQPSGGGTMYLPWCDNKPGFVADILEGVLTKVNPTLFPPPNSAWQNSERYAGPETLAALELDHAEAKRHGIERKRIDKELARAKESDRDYALLLSATGDELHGAVERLLRSVGFEVVNEDARREEDGVGERLEDLQLSDGEYFAVVDVSGVKGDARPSHYNDVLKYMLNQQRLRGNATEVRGMLVVNNEIPIEPSKRADLYMRGETDFPAAAREAGVTLVATWQLHRLLTAVATGILPKADARRLLREPGLFKMPDSPPRQPDSTR